VTLAAVVLVPGEQPSLAAAVALPVRLASAARRRREANC
jgi:hypothetical protein